MRFSKLAVCFNFLLRFWSIFGVPDPKKVMTLSGISHFFNFRKNYQKMPTEAPKSTPNCQELAKKLRGIAKMAKKSSFFRGLIFNLFFGCQKPCPKGPWAIPRHLIRRVQGLPEAWLKSCKIEYLTEWKMLPGSNTPLDRWSGKLSLVPQG